MCCKWSTTKSRTATVCNSLPMLIISITGFCIRLGNCNITSRYSESPCVGVGVGGLERL